ncbi:MAG: DUF2786 domain-containing protein [Actinobacteria bacterium]|nr:DUF2786 domain-containing protein [Actinomycetota bacterium]
MGKRNRQRRREKQHRASSTGRGGPASGPSGPSERGEPGPRRLRAVDDPRFAAQAFAYLADAVAHGQHAVADHMAATLATTPGVAHAASAALRAAAGAAWERGWQPADLVHAFGRKQPGADRRLLVRVVAAEGPAWRAHPHPDPVWLQQLDDLEAEPSPGCIVGDWADREGIDAANVLLRAGQLLAALWTAPALPPVGDPPSRWGTTPSPLLTRRGAGAGAAGIDERILSRVRALLAKAESTEFAPEAEAFTEKAQELMARYAIDHALVAAGGGDTGAEQPVSRRVLIHDPYAKGKATLLAEVGGANRCQAVWCKEFGFSTVFGFPTDLAVTDILYTSLVSQCSTAMRVSSAGVANPRSFRDSFVLSFAIHIGDRLRAATAATVAQATSDHGDALLPVLASRDQQVEAARQEAFPRLRKVESRSFDRRGWLAGQAAAELAQLDAGKRITR